MANDLGDGHYGGGQQGDSLSWAVALLGVGIVAGAYVDAWSRESRAHPMAPWQDVPLEVAWLGLTAVLASALVQNLRGGRTWSDAMPNGLMGCLVGCVVFAVGAIADGQLQHVFPAAVPGGHADLYSPGHILEEAGGGLIVATPFAAAIRTRPNERATWHVLLSAALTLSAATFFFMYLNPMVDVVTAGTVQRGWEVTSLGAAEILVSVMLLTAVMALMVRSFQVPVGGLAIVCAINGLVTAIVKPHFELLPAIAVTALAAEGTYQTGRRYLCQDGVLLPSILGGLTSGTYALACWVSVLLLEGGTWWDTEMWVGVTMAAAVTGAVVGCVLGALPGARADPETSRIGAPGINARAVKVALQAISRPENLAALPLARAMGMTGPPEALVAELTDRLTEGIAHLMSSTDQRTAQAGSLLQFYYVRQIGSQEVVAERLNISRPTFYRRREAAFLELSNYLIEQSLNASRVTGETVHAKFETA